MRKILITFIVWFIFFNLINFISSKIIFDRTSYELPSGITLSYRHVFVPWLNFDGRNYLQIVKNGYDLNYITELRVFFPLYPLLIRILSFNLYLNPVLIGLAISFFCFIGSLFMFDKLLDQDKVKEKYKVFLLLLAFPTSFFFLAYYTESLFFFLVLTTFYFLKKEKFLFAGVLTIFASLTRITGLALIPVFLWEAIIYHKKTKKIVWPVLLTPLGFLIYSLYLQITTGNGLSMISEQTHWNREIGILSPIKAYKEGFIHALWGTAITRGNFFNRSMEIIEFIFGVLLILFIIFSFKKIKRSYWVFVVFSSIPIIFSGVLSSIHRYMLIMFPIYIYLAKIVPKKYFYYLLVVGGLLLAYLSALFLRNYWVA